LSIRWAIICRMPIEKLRILAVNPELNHQLHGVVTHIVADLEREVVYDRPNRFTPLAVFAFGSLLDTSRFDRGAAEGKRSDFDVLVIVAEDFLADDFCRIGMHCSPSNAADFVVLEHLADENDGWGCDRNVHVIVMSAENLTWETARIASLSDQEVVNLLIDDAHLTALAMGFALFNLLDEAKLKGLFRLQRIYHALEVKPGH